MIADPTPPRFESLLLQVDGPIARLALNRPHKLNALSPALMREIIAASQWLATLPDLRVLRFGGEGRAFCAGFDLEAMRESRGGMDRQATDLGRQMIEAIEAIPAITLAEVQGHCVGGGFLLAAVCDLRIAADDARFSIPEMELGIPLGWGGVPRLIRLVGPAAAMELVLDCQPIDAAQALAWRLVNRVVPAADLPAAGLAWAQRLAQRPLNALRTTKQRFRQANEALCTSAGSQADADALLAAYRDPETLGALQRYMAARKA
ncbi:MAG: enoyl-CoA hydratase/isomerase family protein [Rubrivivax sp.]